MENATGGEVSSEKFTPAPLDLEENAEKLELVLDLAEHLPNKYQQYPAL